MPLGLRLRVAVMGDGDGRVGGQFLDVPQPGQGGWIVPLVGGRVLLPCRTPGPWLARTSGTAQIMMCIALPPIANR